MRWRGTSDFLYKRKCMYPDVQSTPCAVTQVDISEAEVTEELLTNSILMCHLPAQWKRSLMLRPVSDNY